MPSLFILSMASFNVGTAVILLLTGSQAHWVIFYAVVGIIFGFMGLRREDAEN